MKIANKTLLIFFAVVTHMTASAQLKEVIKESGKNTVEGQVGNKTENVINGAADKLEKGVKDIFTKKKNKPAKEQEDKVNENTTASGTDETGSKDKSAPSATKKVSPKVYTKYDFVPGNKILFYDNFSEVGLGDFPPRWNSNGSGFTSKIDGEPNTWLEIGSGSVIIPDLAKALPDNYTVEFDLMILGIPEKIDHNLQFSRVMVALLDKPVFDISTSASHGLFYFSLSNYPGSGFANSVKVENAGSAPLPEISNKIDFNTLSLQNTNSHFAIAKNGKRFRLWINELKVVDLPSFVSPASGKFVSIGLKDLTVEGCKVMIANFKIAETGKDFRSQFLSEGKFSTSGIYFVSGSADIKPESYGTLKQIAQLINENNGTTIKITGYTDSDGDDQTNLALSRKRATSVKAALTQDFAVAESLIETDGKGEASPVAPNTTAEGKASNRRVEFMKISK